MPRSSSALVALALGAGLCGCTGFGTGAAPAADEAVLQRAEVDRSEYYRREIERLQADLRQAEEAMVSIESGLRRRHTRANAVSTIAEARIVVERAAEAASWRSAEREEARAKLAEADRQLEAGHFGSAVFFASRARRVADHLNSEARLVAGAGNARFVDVRRLNLRTEPSRGGRVLETLRQDTPVFSERAEGDWMLVRTPRGQVGWVYASMLR